MIERMLRYSGSGAEMISELVAGSAWIIPAMAPPAPPLDDEEPELEAALLVCEVWPEGLCELAPLALPSEELIGVVVRPLPVACCTNDGSLDSTARSSGASFTACALRR